MPAIRLLLILVLSILVRSDIPPATTNTYTDIATTKPPDGTNDSSILSRQQCLRFSSNSNTFGNNQTLMLRNFTKILFSATSHLQVINSFKYYSNSFIQKFIQNAKGLQLLSDYWQRLKDKFGADTLKQYIQNRYSTDCTCLDCTSDTVSYAESVGISDELLQLEEIADTLDDQVFKPLILLPITKYPLFQVPTRRLLQARIPQPPYLDMCVDRNEGRIGQAGCIQECLYVDYQMNFPPNFDPFHPLVNNPNGAVDLEEMNERYIQERLQGLPHFILESRGMRRLVLDSHSNCNRGIFSDICA